MNWIDINERQPTEADTCDGRIAVLDTQGYAIIGILLPRGGIMAEMPFTHWCPLPALLTAHK